MDVKISRRMKWSALISILLIGAFLRFYQLEYKSLWVDEIIQVTLAQQGFFETLQGMRTQVAAPPLDYLITWLMLQFGRNGIVTSEFVLRFPAVMWGVLTIAFGYALAQRATRATLPALITAYLIALAPLLVRFSQEARFYMLSTMLMLALVYFFARAWETPNAKNWTWFALTLLLAFFTHYYVAFVIGALLMYVAGVVVTNLWRARSRLVIARSALCDATEFIAAISNAAELRARVLGTGSALFLLAFLAVPWLLYARPAQAQAQVFAISSFAELIGEPVTSGHVGGAWHLFAVRVLGLIILPVLAVFGTLNDARKNFSLGTLLALIVLVGACGVVFLDWAFHYFFTSRQLLFLVPFYVILISCGLAALYSFLARRNKILGALALFAALSIIGIVFLFSARAYYDWSKDDWRSAARLLAHATDAQPAPIFTDPDSLRGYLTYYQPTLASFIQPNASASDTTRATENQRAWIVTLEQPQPPVLETLQKDDWHSIRLDASPALVISYAGRAPDKKLWNEIEMLDVPSQILIYSDLLEKSRACETENIPLIVNARAALTPPTDPPLLDAQRSLLRRKLRRLC